MQLYLRSAPPGWAGTLSNAAPGWREAWWWLGTPLASFAAIGGVGLLAPEFFAKRIAPEATGLLENLHVLFPAVAFFLSVRLLSASLVRHWKLLRAAIIFFALSTLYMAGEECSWGQWYLYWDTPEAWKAINEQAETNLHNTSYFLNQFPERILEAAIIIGGLLLPIFPRLAQWIPFPIVQFLIPPKAIVPVAATFVVARTVYRTSEWFRHPWIDRPSEVAETFMYMFVMYYMIMLSRRIRAVSFTQA